MTQKRSAELARVQISIPTKWVEYLDNRLISKSAMITHLFEKYLIKEVEDMNKITTEVKE